jgi:hypothetical protein
MSNVQQFLYDQSIEYANVVVPEMTRGVPLKSYTENSYDFPRNNSGFNPVAMISPNPVSTRVDEKNNNVVYN